VPIKPPQDGASRDTERGKGKRGREKKVGKGFSVQRTDAILEERSGKKVLASQLGDLKQKSTHPHVVRGTGFPYGGNRSRRRGVAYSGKLQRSFPWVVEKKIGEWLQPSRAAQRREGRGIRRTSGVKSHEVKVLGGEVRPSESFLPDGKRLHEIPRLRPHVPGSARGRGD